jgi:DNA modification methylase
MSTQQFVDDIWLADCTELLKRFEDESVDLVVTSPPYDNLRNYKGFKFPFEDIASELTRVIKPGGVIVWVVNDATIEGSESGTSFRQALHFRGLGLNIHDTMIFRKRNPVPQIYRKRYTNEFEYMFVFSKGLVETHNPMMVECLHAGLELGMGRDTQEVRFDDKQDGRW